MIVAGTVSRSSVNSLVGETKCRRQEYARLKSCSKVTSHGSLQIANSGSESLQVGADMGI